jgi:hypothetical protein
MSAAERGEGWLGLDSEALRNSVHKIHVGGYQVDLENRTVGKSGDAERAVMSLALINTGVAVSCRA